MKHSVSIGMPLAILATLALALGALPALAQHSIDDWPEGSAMHTAFLMAERLDRAEAELATRHEELVALATDGDDLFGTRVGAALEELHTVWPQYRSRQCELHGSLTRAGGTWPTTHALICDVEQTEQRVTMLDGAIACLDALPAGERRYQVGECVAAMLPPLENR